MNIIQKQKTTLIILGVASLVLSILLLVGGILLLINGVPAVAEAHSATKGIVYIVFGSISLLLFLPAAGFGIYDICIGAAVKATTGSIKEGNIAKEGGTVNMKKCDRCGTEIKAGETVCSECKKPVE